MSDPAFLIQVFDLFIQFGFISDKDRAHTIPVRFPETFDQQFFPLYPESGQIFADVPGLFFNDLTGICPDRRMDPLFSVIKFPIKIPGISGFFKKLHFSAHPDLTPHRYTV